MEASEKQLPIDHAEEGAVRALGDRLVIERLEIADERSARVVRERAESGRSPAETVTKAIEIGARVLDSEETAANVDYVRAELERGVGELSKDLAGTLEEGNDALADRIASAFGADRSDSVQQQIKEIVGRANEEQRSAIARLFAADDGANPLADFKSATVRAISESEQRHRQEATKLRESHETEQRAMREQLSGLREQVARLTEKDEGDSRLAEAEARGTAKGRSFEERVYSALDRIAGGRGDVAQHVGDERGDGGGKQGDVVIEIEAAAGAPAGRIVFEVKDERLSKNVAWKVLNEAMVQRDAEFAVLVVAGEDRVPAGREPLHEYEGNKLIVAADPEEPDGIGVEVAYRLARCRVLMARDSVLEVDAAGVRNAAEEAVSALKRVQKIRLALTGATDRVDSAREGLDEMVAAVHEKLDRIDGLVSAAADET